MPRTCPDCLYLLSECGCIDDEPDAGSVITVSDHHVTADPDAFGKLLRGMLGPPSPQQGPPYTHVHAFPVIDGEEAEDEEASELPPPAYSIVKRGRPYENGPLEAPAAFRRLSPDMLTDTEGPGCYFPPPSAP